MKRLFNYFTRTERILWAASVTAITVSFIFAGGSGFLSLAASLIGVTSLILNAKANPLGQALMVVFSVLYGIISYSFRYYGEMLTYLGMSMPMAVFSLVTWLRHPFGGKKSEVEIIVLKRREHAFMWVLTAAVTAVFYFILKAMGTANLIPSTVSVTTSFAAVYFSARRSPYYAAAYAANDIVLLVLWVAASVEDNSYSSVVVCFAAFLINDIYGFLNWRKIAKRQFSVSRIGKDSAEIIS